jgi:hypothetical protein
MVSTQNAKTVTVEYNVVLDYYWKAINAYIGAVVRDSTDFLRSHWTIYRFVFDFSDAYAGEFSCLR